MLPNLPQPHTVLFRTTNLGHSYLPLSPLAGQHPTQLHQLKTVMQAALREGPYIQVIIRGWQPRPVDQALNVRKKYTALSTGGRGS